METQTFAGSRRKALRFFLPWFVGALAICLPSGILALFLPPSKLPILVSLSFAVYFLLSAGVGVWLARGLLRIRLEIKPDALSYGDDVPDKMSGSRQLAPPRSGSSGKGMTDKEPAGKAEADRCAPQAVLFKDILAVYVRRGWIRSDELFIVTADRDYIILDAFEPSLNHLAQEIAKRAGVTGTWDSLVAHQFSKHGSDQVLSRERSERWSLDGRWVCGLALFPALLCAGGAALPELSVPDQMEDRLAMLMTAPWFCLMALVGYFVWPRYPHKDVFLVSPEWLLIGRPLLGATPVARITEVLSGPKPDGRLTFRLGDTTFIHAGRAEFLEEAQRILGASHGPEAVQR